MLNNPFQEEIIPDVQPEHPLARPKVLSSSPVADFPEEEAAPHLDTLSFQALVESYYMSSSHLIFAP